MEWIVNRLFEYQDLKFADFHAALIPTVKRERVIGVRTPVLRKLAKEIIKKGDAEEFLQELPHTYFDEMQLHAFILGEIKDYEQAVESVRIFLPHVDNWATCDQLKPKGIACNKDALLAVIKRWITDEHAYTIRFGIKMLMDYYLDDDFDAAYLEIISAVKSEEYYVNMMIAWFFATALAKQYDDAVKIMETDALDLWVHNKTIQKAVESYRISDEQKEYLKSMRRKAGTSVRK